MAADLLFGHDWERAEIWQAALEHAQKYRQDERKQQAVMIANEVMRRLK